MFAHDPAIADNTSSHDTATVQDFIRRYDDTIAAADFDTLPSFFDDQILVITPTSSRCVTRAEFVAAAEARAAQMVSPVRTESPEQPSAEPAARGSDSSPRAELIEQATTPLGGHCWLTSAHWRLTLGDRPLELYSDFVVRRTDDDLRIAAYLPRQDLPQLLNEAAGQV
ncbi:hypothetical protein AB0M22_24980 [Nocardia sp. NPDC051756]|uniref:hypothetical protein n=1 Tax=Nocardia sp. NPDC051756 TaxID=3154751 RepID=UPI003415CBDB